MINCVLKKRQLPASGRFDWMNKYMCAKKHPDFELDRKLSKQLVLHSSRSEATSFSLILSSILLTFSRNMILFFYMIENGFTSFFHFLYSSCSKEQVKIELVTFLYFVMNKVPFSITKLFLSYSQNSYLRNAREKKSVMFSSIPCFS